VYLGDTTGASNSHAEITYVRFLQGSVSPVDASTWGRVRRMYAGAEASR